MMVEQAKDFQDFHYALADSRSALTVAEAHGSLCGILCSPALETNIDEWFDHTLEGVAAGQQAELREKLESLVGSTEEQLDSADFTFAPLLTDDDQADLAERVQALVDWSSSFIFGFGLGNGVPEELPEDGWEFFQDLQNFCRLDIPDAPDESAERAYTELVEYLKIGVLLLRNLKLGSVFSSQSPH
jgi:uncharacterized protein YgfB (UPF0149 family)